jgi:HPt (histidine-containing phosphotransfer) domain-containing protein
MLHFFRKKENEQVSVKSEGLYNLEELYEIGGADYIMQIIEIFLRDSPPSLQSMKEAMQANDASKVMLSAHKLKGSAGIVKATRLYTLLNEAEQIAATGVCNAQLEKIIFSSSDTYVAIESSLQSLFKILKSRG